MSICEGDKVDPEFAVDLLIAVVARATRDALRNPRRWPDALPFLAEVAGPHLRDQGGRQISSPEDLGAALRVIWRQKGGRVA